MNVFLVRWRWRRRHGNKPTSITVIITPKQTTSLHNGEYDTWSHLVPCDLWLSSGLNVVVYVGTEDVFALTQLGLLEVPHLGVVAETRVVLGHRERHRHFHTVRGVPAKHTKSTQSTSLTETGISFALEKAFKRSFFRDDRRERGISRLHYDERNFSEIPVLYCRNESVNARLKGSAVFSHHSQQLFLCLSWAQDISDQQKWERRASRPFFSFVRVALSADASYCHNWIYWKTTPWTEETTQCRTHRRKDRKCWLKEQWTETKRPTEWN